MSELKLSATQSNWRLFTIRDNDPRFSKTKQAVFRRDRNQCVYCGFTAQSGLCVVNLEGNYRKNHMANMLTACPLCAQCGFLESVGVGDYGGGVMIYLPDISQVELNALCHNLFSAMTLCTDSENTSKAIYRDLRMRAQWVEKSLGAGMSRPDNLGRLLIDASDNAAFDASWMEGLRLLPSYVRCMSSILRWADDALASFS